MRIAVLSDIHGFSLAFQTVLDDLERSGPFDEVIVAGDLCAVGPDPAGVLALLGRHPAFTVLTGNTDRDLVEAAGSRDAGGADRFALREIGEDEVAYLANLVFSRRITPPGGTAPLDDLLAVHANPHNLDEKLTPEMSDRAAREVIGDTRAAVLAFGHHHVAFERRVDGMVLVDVSAVGNPKDGDLRCKYGVFTWDEVARAWSVEQRKLPYPLDETEDQIRASGLPDPDKTFRKLRQASY